ncbi:hypothetical protein SR1949_13180 [Sphaerospermopsis reniformis]|uniref:ARC6 IMS domain-containing protein n=1 Tax=Sphaerospermopsis reniformis TaxID=531300 RepID=A0A479ZXB6_9CYAN|nr:hypothetical protein [Sphaerospermopsis reniformis]GCL36216.1 hypothetical protein SR1949_13180 [Sphaerospermopsis reniformis]
MKILLRIKNLFIYSTFISIMGCQNQSFLSNYISSSGCSEKPTVSLNAKDVEAMVLNESTITKSGQVSINKSVGYTFMGKTGNKLVYQTNQNICIWVYTPDNKLMNNPVLPVDGKYIIQIAAMEGATTFDVALQLQKDAETPISLTQSSLSETKQTKNSNRQDPDVFIRNYYLSLNNREYSQTWSNLSDQFKNYSSSYSEYQQWWNSVKEIKIGNIEIVNISNNTASIDAELWYYMNDGRELKDTRNRIYLIWSENNNTWLINDKSEP